MGRGEIGRSRGGRGKGRGRGGGGENEGVKHMAREGKEHRAGEEMREKRGGR